MPTSRRGRRRRQGASFVTRHNIWGNPDFNLTEADALMQRVALDARDGAVQLLVRGEVAALPTVTVNDSFADRVRQWVDRRAIRLQRRKPHRRSERTHAGRPDQAR